MPCPRITTGENFLSTTLLHIDCQAQTLGSFGFAALANPYSPASLALTSLLTIFIALFGIRLLLGYPMAGRDLVGDIIKIGIVLTLATSWPAWRVIGYDLVIDGPAQLAQAIGGGAGIPGTSGDLIVHLQQIDNGLAALNDQGSGRLGGAQGDWFQLGFARIVFLAGSLGPLVLVRLAAGFLLAIAPLVAGLILFGITRPLFIGWARGLVMTFLAALALSLFFGVEIALLEPWLADALAKRAADQPILQAPVEVLALTLAFAVASLGSITAMARIAFYPAGIERALPLPPSARGDMQPKIETTPGSRELLLDNPSRATVVALSISENIRRQERLIEGARLGTQGGPGSEGFVRSDAIGKGEMGDTLGSSYRRSTRRVSAAGSRPDLTR